MVWPIFLAPLVRKPDVIVWLRARDDIDSSLQTLSDLNLPQLAIPAVQYVMVPALPVSQTQPLVFASRRAVEFFHAQGFTASPDCCHFVIGQRTRISLEQLFPHLKQVQVFSSFAHFLEQCRHVKEVLYPCSEQYVMEEVTRASESGMRLVPVVVYRPEELDIRESLAEVFSRFSCPAFPVLAPSQSRPLQAYLERDFIVFCMGRRTFEQLLQLGFRRVIVANDASLAALKEAVVRILEEES